MNACVKVKFIVPVVHVLIVARREYEWTATLLLDVTWRRTGSVRLGLGRLRQHISCSINKHFTGTDQGQGNR